MILNGVILRNVRAKESLSDITGGFSNLIYPENGNGLHLIRRNLGASATKSFKGSVNNVSPPLSSLPGCLLFSCLRGGERFVVLLMRAVTWPQLLN